MFFESAVESGHLFYSERLEMRSRRIFIVAILFTSLFAIAEEPAAVQAESGQSKATLYVYRYKQFVGKALSPSVYCDEAELARMENGRYFTVRLDPGKHSFRSNDKQSGVDLDMKDGQSYFMRVEIATGFMKGHGRLILVAGEQAGYELKQLKPSDGGKVVDKTRVSIAEANLEAPSSAAKSAAAEQPKPTPSFQAPTTSSTNSGGNLTPVNQVTTGDESLGDASRRLKQKKPDPQ